ncbi:MAG: DinB family protein [Gemmatimonadaceae bacterium]
MRVTDLERLYDYNYWANKKLFAVITQLTPEQFTGATVGSYGSIRNTLVHTMSAEWGWLDRCGGTKRGPQLKADDFPTFESVAQTWERVEGYVREFLSGLKDEDLSRKIEFTLGGPTHSIPLGDLMHHAAIHAVHHRGQVALLLRTLGYVPGNFDYLFFAGGQ